MTDLASIQINVDTRQVKQAQSDIKGLGTTAGDVEKQTKQSTEEMSSSFGKVSGAVKILTGVLAAVGIGTLVRGFADTVMESERLKGALTTMTGSADNAAFAFSELTKFASETPFTLDQSVQGFIKLQALGLDPSERALRSYGNTASAMGKDMMQMIEAVADASTGEFERLKEFGIKASKEGDQVSLTFQGVTKTIGNSSQEIQEYLLNIGEVQFGTAMADQMQRLPGLLSNLQDNIGNLFRTLGDSGGVKIFGSIIAAASAGVVMLTDNVDILIIGVQAFVAAFSVIAGPAAIVAGFSAIRAAVIGLNTVIMANPIAAVAAATAAAAVIIYNNWDTIKQGAQSAALNIEIAWNELKLFLLEAFSPALNAISGLFTDVKNKAIATWTAIAAAARDPLNAISTFNDTFDQTLTRLQAGERESNTFAGAVVTTRSRIVELEGKLAVLNTTTATAEDVIDNTGRSLSDFAIVSEDAADETAGLNMKALELLGTLSDEREMLKLNALEMEIFKNLRKAGEVATSELGAQIVESTTALYNETEALKAVNTESKAAEKASEALGKASEAAAKQAEENWQRTHEYLTNTFIDIFNNGKNAFSNIAESFTAMIKRMIAEWAASKLMNLFGIGGGSGNTATSVLSGLLGGGAGGGGGGSIGGSVASSAINSVITGSGGGLLAAGGQFLGGLAGTAVGTGSAIVGPPTAAAAAGSGIMSSIGGALAAVPGWGWALAGLGAAAAIFAKDATPSANAGMLVGPAPGASADRLFSVPAFASGFQPTGFARRENQDAALDVIAHFAAMDAALTTKIREAGGYINMSSATLSGWDEKGQGSGVFMGLASEDGTVTSVGLDQQLKRYAADVMRHASGLTDEQKQAVLMGVHGSHANGLAMVPFDGYRAELHKGEEVLRKDDPRNQNNDSASKLDALTMQVALYTKRFSEILDDWDVRGLPAERPA